MKVELIETQREKEITYPCLMISREKAVVLFYRRDEGVCLKHSILEEIGKYADYWDITQFKPFTGKVVLSNE